MNKNSSDMKNLKEQFLEIPYDHPYPNRHNLTAYVCREHFRMIVGKLG